MQAPGKPNGPLGMVCPRRNVDCGAENGCKVCYDWVHMEGEDAVTGDKFSAFDCVAHWQLKIGLHLIRSVGAGLDGVQKATESFRNETVKANQQACQIIAATAIQRNGSMLLIEDKDG